MNKKKIRNISIIGLAIMIIGFLFMAKNDILFTYYLRMGYHYHQKEEYLYAINYYNKILMLEGYEETYGVIQNIGTIYSIVGYYSDAIDCFNRCLKINDKDENIYYNLGLTYYLKQDYADSKMMLDESLKINENCYQSYALLGDLDLKQLNYNNAIKNYEKYLKYNPSDSVVINKLEEVKLSAK